MRLNLLNWTCCLFVCGEILAFDWYWGVTTCNSDFVLNGCGGLLVLTYGLVWWIFLHVWVVSVGFVSFTCYSYVYVCEMWDSSWVRCVWLCEHCGVAFMGCVHWFEEVSDFYFLLCLLVRCVWCCVCCYCYWVQRIDWFYWFVNENVYTHIGYEDVLWILPIVDDVTDIVALVLLWCETVVRITTVFSTFTRLMQTTLSLSSSTRCSRSHD